MNGELAAAMTQLLRTDYDSFVRYGITQFTQGGFDEDTAGRMVARFPPADVAAQIWEMHVGQPEPIGELLGALDKPLLLAKHDGCLAFTAEGYESAVGRLSDRAPGDRREDLAGERRVRRRPARLLRGRAQRPLTRAIFVPLCPEDGRNSPKFGVESV